MSGSAIDAPATANALIATSLSTRVGISHAAQEVQSFRADNPGTSPTLCPVPCRPARPGPRFLLRPGGLLLLLLLRLRMWLPSCSLERAEGEGCRCRGEGYLWVVWVAADSPPLPTHRSSPAGWRPTLSTVWVVVVAGAPLPRAPYSWLPVRAASDIYTRLCQAVAPTILAMAAVLLSERGRGINSIDALLAGC